MLLGLPWVLLALAAGAVEPPKEPAKIKLSVSPQPVAPGGSARLRVELEPIEGVKISRYPRIELQVQASEGLVEAAKAAMGSEVPPPPEKLETENHFDHLEPLDLALSVGPAATEGQHELQGRLTFAYCMLRSGFCSRVRVPLKIPLVVHR